MLNHTSWCAQCSKHIAIARVQSVPRGLNPKSNKMAGLEGSEQLLAGGVLSRNKHPGIYDRRGLGLCWIYLGSDIRIIKAV